MPIELRISGLSGEELCRLSVARSCTLEEVKAAVAQAASIPACHQRLLVGAVEWQDEAGTLGEQLSDAAVAEITLLRRPVEQGYWLGRVQANGLQLAEAPSRLRADRSIVLAAVRQDGSAIVHAAKEFWGDHDVVLAAVKQSGDSLRHAAPEARANREIVVTAARQSGSALSHAGIELRADRNVVLAAIQRSPCALLYAAEALRGDREFMLAAVRSDESGDVLRFAMPEIRADREVVVAAVRRNWRAIHHAPREFLEDDEIVNVCAMQNLEALRYVAAKPGLDAGMPNSLLGLCMGEGHEFGAKILLPGEARGQQSVAGAPAGGAARELHADRARSLVERMRTPPRVAGLSFVVAQAEPLRRTPSVSVWQLSGAEPISSGAGFSVAQRGRPSLQGLRAGSAGPRRSSIPGSGSRPRSSTPGSQVFRDGGLQVVSAASRANSRPTSCEN